MMRTRIFSRCIIIGLVFLTFTSACEFPADAVKVFNASSQTVELVEESGDTRISLTKLRPGMGFSSRGECVHADFVVLSLEGEELARRPGPFCQEEPEWVITDEMLAGTQDGT